MFRQYIFVCACLLVGRVSEMWKQCKSQRQPVLSQHSTSDPLAFWEQVKLKLIVQQKKGCLAVKCNAKNIVSF